MKRGALFSLHFGHFIPPAHGHFFRDLTNDPCSVRQEPEIVFNQSQEPSTETQALWRKRIQKDMGELRRIDRRVLCGLERIEILDREKFSDVEKRPDIAAHYSPRDRLIRFRHYSRKTLFHEVGHHVHNPAYRLEMGLERCCSPSC